MIACIGRDRYQSVSNNCFWSNYNFTAEAISDMQVNNIAGICLWLSIVCN